MRLALLIRDLGYAGAQRQLVALAKGLNPKEVQTTVFSFYGGPLQAELEAAGIPVVCFGKKHRWDMLGFLWRAARSLRQFRPDVLYSFLSESNLLAAVVARPLLPRTKLVWGLRDSETDAALYGWLGRLVFTLGRVFSRCAHLIIANSKSGARYYAAQGYPAKHIVVVPNGIDTDRFQPNIEVRDKTRAELGVGPDEALFGIVGRLSPMKDYPTFLQAASNLDARCRFLCIGGGSSEYAKTMQSVAADLGLGSRIVWSPPRSDMPEVYNALDALVSSSAFGEGFSNVTGEAMACGTPCIVTEVGDSAWLVGDSGFTAPPRQPLALETAMRQFLALTSSERDDLKHKARQRIVQNFTVPKMVERTAALLSSDHAKAEVAETVRTPLKLVFIITALGTGGAEMMLTQLVTHLDRERFEPVVISLTEGGKYAALLAGADIPVHHLGMAAGKPSLRSLLRLRTLIRQLHPDLIVGWMYHGNLAATLASWFGKHVPVLWNVRQSLYSLELEKRGSAMVIKALARLRFNPRHILYNSQVSAHQHEALGYAPRKTLVVPNGFNTDTFKPDPGARRSVREELGLSPGTPLIGRFGRHTAMKDYPSFIAAMVELEKTHPDARAIIAGTGTEEIKDAPANVIILRERHDLPRLTAALDIACSSSAFGEGFPNVVAEAMSCAVPCVVTDVGDSAWLLGSGGHVVPAHDPKALAESLSKLLSLPAHEREALGAQGRERILANFSLPAVLHQFESLFTNSALSTRR